MMNGKVGMKHEVNFEFIKFSKKRGTEERFFFKNVVLDVGFDEWIERHFTMPSANPQNKSPDFLFLGTGTTEPTREDLGLESVSTTVPARLESGNTAATSFLDRDPDHGNMWIELQRSHVYGEGEAVGTWTEAGLAFWDKVGSSPSNRGNDNTYTYPYSRSLFRKGIDYDKGTASSATSTTLVDSSKSWDVGRWDDDYTVYIVDGTGAGQSREIISSTGDTLNVAAWDVEPDSTSVYAIRGTPIAVTVLSDEFLTVISHQRIYLPHKLNHWEGTFLWKNHEIPYTAYVLGGAISTGGISQGQISIARRGPPKHGNLNMLTPPLTNFTRIRWGGSEAGFEFNLAEKRITSSINLSPAASDRLIWNFGLSPNFGPQATDVTWHIQIDPDWSVLPEEEREWTTRSSPNQYVLVLPEGQRFQGQISWTIFRVDD